MTINAKKLSSFAFIGAMICSFSSSITATATVAKQYVFFDLYNTLLKSDKLRQGWETGFGPIIKYILHGGKVDQIECRFFEFLGQNDQKPYGPDRPDSPKGHCMPDLMIKWQRGQLTGSQVIAQARDLAKNNPRFFKNKAERKLLLALSEFTFTADRFIGCLSVNNDLEKVARELAQSDDVEICVLSNMDAETLAQMYKSPVLGPVLKMFTHVFTSSDLGAMKPEAACFAAVCERLKISPEQCMLIDDQPKNIEGARKAGWNGIHYTGNTHNVRTAMVGLLAKVLPATKTA